MCVCLNSGMSHKPNNRRQKQNSSASVWKKWKWWEICLYHHGNIWSNNIDLALDTVLNSLNRKGPHPYVTMTPAPGSSCQPKTESTVIHVLVQWVKKRRNEEESGFQEFPPPRSGLTTNDTSPESSHQFLILEVLRGDDGVRPRGWWNLGLVLESLPCWELLSVSMLGTIVC